MAKTVTEEIDLSQEFFVQLDLSRNALLSADLAGMAGADEKKIDLFIRKYRMPLPKDLLQEVPADPKLTDLPALSADRFRRLAKAQEVAMVGNIPASKLAILKSQGNIEEKVKLLATLKVVGTKEVVPYLLPALADLSPKVKIEAIRGLPAIPSRRSPTRRWRRSRRSATTRP